MSDTKLEPEQSEADILELLAEYRRKYTDLDPQACMVFGTAEMTIKRLSAETRPAKPTRDALMDLYTWCQGLNDFRPDSKVARNARAAIVLTSC